MGKQQRFRRVAEEIKKEVSDILRSELKDPRIVKMTSVTDVETSRDISYAKIFVSIYGDKDEQETILKVLNKAAGFIRSEIGKRIRIRHTPEIEFLLDRSMEYGAHIESVLKELEPDRGAEKLE
ncbi:MAG: 30S ribosome-binding factor RbfA [Bacillota bacterium]|nr:30S ribosome-binding factor RbfA [Bacillota bacterium]